MTALASLARLIRSKNAGPFELTFDIMFDDAATYRRVKESGVLTRDKIAACYGLEPAQVKFFLCDNALAIKASIPRPYFQGDPRDSDGHGGHRGRCAGSGRCRKTHYAFERLSRYGPYIVRRS